MKGLKRILSGVLASILLGQVLIYGDGSSQGIAHAQTIEDIKNSINKWWSGKRIYVSTDNLMDAVSRMMK